VVATRDSKVIRLADIAGSPWRRATTSYRASANGREAVVLAINAAPTANPINIAHDVLELLPSLKSNMPSTMEVTSCMTHHRHQRIHPRGHQDHTGGGRHRTGGDHPVPRFVPGGHHPHHHHSLSLIGVVMMMDMFGFSINLMTLLAMVLAIGLVVDDAIVVLENVDRHIKEGEELFRAAIIGTREIAVPVIAMTVTLAAVYAPIALMGGITGSLFKEFALTLAGAVFVSGIIALTLSPMMCAKMLRANEEPGKFERKVHRSAGPHDGPLRRHAPCRMQKRIVVILFAVIVFASLPMLFKFIPKLAPSEDKGVMAVLGTAPSNANLDYIENTMEQVNKVLTTSRRSLTPRSSRGVQLNQAFGIASMVPWSQREARQKEVLERVGKLVENVPGMAITTFQFPELPGASSGLPIQFVITTPNSFEPVPIAGEMLAATQGNGRFVYSDLDLNYDSATMKISIDKDKAGAYGITMQDIGITMGTMMADGYVNRIDLDGRSYEVIPQVERKFRLNPESIKGYYVRAADGKSIPLGTDQD
jgi:multidrug efflux pump